MRRAPWISVAPCVPASCYHRGMGERFFELWASTARRVARFCSTQNCVRHFVFASRAGCHWLFERFRRDRRIRPQSWKARCVTPILFFRVCVCLSSDYLGVLLQGPWVSIKKTAVCHDHSISANPDPAHIAHHFSSAAEPLLLVLIAQ